MTEVPETAAEYLRAATALLRGNAGAATHGPWRSDYSESGCVTSVDPRHPIIAEYGATWDDSEYIAMMHPDVALAVADWLESTAWQVDPEHSERMRWSAAAGLAVPPECAPALAVAAVVLGRSWPS